MKRILLRGMCAAVAVCAALATPHPASANTISGISGAPVKSFTLASGQTLTVNVNGTGTHGAVVVKAVDGTTTMARAWCIIYNGPEQQPSAARVQSIAPLAAENVTWSAATGTLTVNGNALNDERVGVMLSIPVNTYVVFKQDGKLTKAGFVRNSFMVQGGEVFTNLPAYDERAAIAETLDDAGTDCVPTAGPQWYYQACGSSDAGGAPCSINWQVGFAAGNTLEAVVDDACH